MVCIRQYSRYCHTVIVVIIQIYARTAKESFANNNRKHIRKLEGEIVVV